MPVQIERDRRGVITAWLDNRPKRNAMDDGMLGALATLLEEVSGERGARAVVVRGRNGCFCSGRDLGELAAAAGDHAERLAPIARLARAFRQCGVPVVAAVEGKAAGLGVSLVCWSDLAISAHDAMFSLPEARAGIAPSVTTVSLIEAIGRRRAMDLCLTGRSIDPDTAARIGLVQYTCRPQELASGLDTVLDDLLKGGPDALRLAKELGREADGQAFDTALAAALATAERCFRGSEIAEGLAALRERRAPSWQRPVQPPRLAEGVKS